MNKLMGIPLAIMILLTAMSFLQGGQQMTSTTELTDEGSIIVENETLDVPTVGSKNVNIWDSAVGAVAVLSIAIAVSITAGVRLLSSGLSGFSQMMIFQLIAMVGIWLILSATGGAIITNGSGEVGFMAYIALTVMFVLGFVTNFAGGDVSD